MVNHYYSAQTPQELNGLRLSKTYFHSRALKQWLLQAERNFEVQELEPEAFSFQHLEGLKK